MSIELVKKILSEVPQKSGVYRFYDGEGKILYVGKAKNLKKRIQSYARLDQTSSRIAKMVEMAQRLEYTVTRTEPEALILEYNLIKKLNPKFNILLRDDKSFVHIELNNHKFPRIGKCHKSENPELVGKNKGTLFGPFVIGSDANHLIDIVRKVFMLRNCSDAEFRRRQRPCMEYQIKRCSAPCVGLVLEDDYKKQVMEVIDFLNGNNGRIEEQLEVKMKELCRKEEFEQAAVVRDQIKALNSAIISDREQLALQEIERKLLRSKVEEKLLLQLKKLFDLTQIPRRIEVYDNSHISGTNAVGAMIVAGQNGFVKSEYRRFNIRFEEMQKRDDTAMLKHVLRRRFKRLIEDARQNNAEPALPDLLVIDGGVGQMHAAQEVFIEIGISPKFVCMAKGEKRNAGEETYFQLGKSPVILPKNDPLAYYLQRLRDEAHRFAITSHKKRRERLFL